MNALDLPAASSRNPAPAVDQRVPRAPARGVYAFDDTALFALGEAMIEAAGAAAAAIKREIDAISAHFRNRRSRRAAQAVGDAPRRIRMIAARVRSGDVRDARKLLRCGTNAHAPATGY